MAAEQFYDRIGAGYSTTRQADPRIQQRIHRALGDAGSVVNVGAGAGSYEPRDREVVAVEPSERMIAQRPSGSAPVVRASAEDLPFRDRARGLREMRRVASRRAVLFTWDQARVDDGWLIRDFLPGFRGLPGMPLSEIADDLGTTEIQTVPIPADCRDGFFHAY